MPLPGRLPYPGNPLKVTTAGIARAWREELAALRSRLHELRTDTAAPTTPEAEGLRRRIEMISASLADLALLPGEPEEWRREVPAVSLGSLVHLAFADGGEEACLLVGLAGPEADAAAVTPASPLGAAILGRPVGETVSYFSSGREYRVTIRRCLVPGGPGSTVAVENVPGLAGRDEEEEARLVAMAIHGLLAQGTPPEAVAVTWRLPLQGGPLELACARGGLGYRLAGESFFVQPEVRGAVAGLRALADRYDAGAYEEFLRFCGTENIVAQYLAEYTPRCLDLTPAEALAGLAGMLRGERPALFRSGPGCFWPILLTIAAPYRRLRSFLAQIQDLAPAASANRDDGVFMAPLDRLDGRACEVLFLAGAVAGALPSPGADPGEEFGLLRRAAAGARRVAVSWSAVAGGVPARPSPFASGLAKTE